MRTMAEWATRQLGEPTRLSPASARRTPLTEATIVALAVGAGDLVLGVYLALRYHLITGDALSRVANAYYVFASRTPHLAAIGFVWNPLPSMLELPLVALHHLYPPIVTEGLAAVWVTALAAALSTYFMVRIAAGFGLPLGYRLAVGLLFAMNPLILLYSVDGMSDLLMVAALLGAVEGVLAYLDLGTLRGLTSAAIWLAIGLWVRYEAVPIAALMTIGLVVGLHTQGREKAIQRGVVALFLAPIAYSGGLWMYANWLIMKNPLYFMTSLYGNASQIATGTYATTMPVILAVKYHALLSLWLAASFSLLFSPFILGLLLTAWFAVRSRGKDVHALVLLGAALGAPLLQAFLLYRGESAAWARYFFYYIPMGFVLVMFSVHRLTTGHSWRNVAMVCSLCLLLLGDASTYMVVRSSAILGHGDQSYFADIVHGKSVNEMSQNGIGDEVLAYLNAHPRLTVLMDTFQAFSLFVNARNPHRFVITSDLDFNSILLNPGNRVDAFLVPQPEGLGAVDAINQAWPGLWAGRVGWVHLMKAFPDSVGYRLYAVEPDAP